jgi:hypothetical protein
VRVQRDDARHKVALLRFFTQFAYEVLVAEVDTVQHSDCERGSSAGSTGTQLRACECRKSHVVATA